MITIHLGHHFFGAGNVGDDFMLAGFLSVLPSTRPVILTCCVPHPREPLANRFPAVEWLPYDPATRRKAVESCDLWLGLGGSPFQSGVSRWFADHLAQETEFCEKAGKPMFFLGIGGQDEASYALPEIRSTLAATQMIWTRDAETASRVADAGRVSRVRVGADLAHLFFAANPPPAAVAGRLTAVLNFEYGDWPALEGAAAALHGLHATEQVWLAQESRALPGAEKWLFDRLSAKERARWRFQEGSTDGIPVSELIARWPSGQWLLTARYHAALAGAWAGSLGVVIATNQKLRGAARDCGFATLAPDAEPNALPALFAEATPTHRSSLTQLATRAREACNDFFRLSGVA